MITQTKLHVLTGASPIVVTVLLICHVFNTSAQIDYKILKKALAKDSVKNKLPYYEGGQMQLMSELYRYVAPGPPYQKSLCAAFDLSVDGKISKLHFFREGMFTGIDSVAFEKAMLRLRPWHPALFKNKPTALTNYTMMIEEAVESVIMPSDAVKDEISPTTETEVYFIADQPAVAPGGLNALMKRAKIVISRPACFAKDSAIKNAKVYTLFIVDTLGQCIGAEIAKPVNNCPELSVMALNLIKSEERWEPARNNNKKVKVIFNLPIVFVFKD